MKFIKKFVKFNKKSFIEDIIDKEIKKSKDFGLKISKKHIIEEKNIIIPIFINFFDEIKSLNDQNYTKYRNIISNFIFDKLENLVKYYFEISKNDSVKNKYNCHLTSIIDSLFMEISNKK